MQLGDRRGSFNPAAFDLGERILKDTKIEQSQQQRLKNIEQELVSLQNQVDNEVRGSPYGGPISEINYNIILFSSPKFLVVCFIDCYTTQ